MVVLFVFFSHHLYSEIEVFCLVLGKTAITTQTYCGSLTRNKPPNQNISTEPRNLKQANPLVLVLNHIDGENLSFPLFSLKKTMRITLSQRQLSKAVFGVFVLPEAVSLPSSGRRAEAGPGRCGAVERPNSALSR